MGKPIAASGTGLAKAYMDGLDCDISRIPVIHSVRSGFSALPDTTVSTSFGATINPFGFNPSALPSGFTGVQSTLASSGQAQTFVMAVGVFVHLEPEGWQWSVPGNAWGPGGVVPPAATSALPLSPDAFMANLDNINQSDTGTALGITAGDTFDPAILDWGGWIDRAFRHMALGYNWVWNYGRFTTLMNVPLRHIAYMPDLAEGVGTMPVETAQYVARVNALYRTLGASAIFLPQNARRTGSVTTAAGSHVSKFSPDRSYDRVEAILGGARLRGLTKNNEKVFRLPNPYVFRPGVDFGMQFAVSDSSEQTIMQQEMSITQGLKGAVPPSILPDANVNSGTSTSRSTAFAVEQTSDSPPVQIQAMFVYQRRIYKGGLGYMTVGLVGYELKETQVQQLQNDPAALDYLYQQSGMSIL